MEVPPPAGLQQDVHQARNRCSRTGRQPANPLSASTTAASSRAPITNGFNLRIALKRHSCAPQRSGRIKDRSGIAGPAGACRCLGASRQQPRRLDGGAGVRPGKLNHPVYRSELGGQAGPELAAFCAGAGGGAGAAAGAEAVAGCGGGREVAALAGSAPGTATVTVSAVAAAAAAP